MDGCDRPPAPVTGGSERRALTTVDRTAGVERGGLLVDALAPRVLGTVGGASGGCFSVGTDGASGGTDGAREVDAGGATATTGFDGGATPDTGASSESAPAPSSASASDAVSSLGALSGFDGLSGLGAFSGFDPCSLAGAEPPGLSVADANRAPAPADTAAVSRTTSEASVHNRMWT